MATSKLTIQFVPYSEIDGLGSGERIKRLLKIVLGDKLVILQGRLKPEEEARLIEDTMALIGHIKGFKGVELAVLNPKQQQADVLSSMKRSIAKVLIGDRESITVIGPSNMVREIKKDPSKMELLLKSRR